MANRHNGALIDAPVFLNISPQACNVRLSWIVRGGKVGIQPRWVARRTIALAVSKSISTEDRQIALHRNHQCGFGFGVSRYGHWYGEAHTD